MDLLFRFDVEDESIGNGGRNSNIVDCGKWMGSVVLNDSKAYSSSLTSDGSSEEIQARRLRIVAIVARCHEMKLQVNCFLCFSASAESCV